MELTRRGFLGSTVGATAAGLGWGGALAPVAAASAALASPTLALADDEGSQVEPRPIPNGDAGTHHFLPGRGKEVTTITDFNGFVGIGQLTGTGTATGFAQKLNFSVDNRFLVGEFIGVDGKHHRGAFGVFWLDLWTGPVGQGHIHDFNPGIAPSGLFWTAHVPMSSIEIDLRRTTASFQLKDFALLDTIPNVAATVSLSMDWHGKRAEVDVKDLVNGFGGSYQECSATIAWSGEEAGFSFVSDPPSTSMTRFAEIGRERNGVFFRGGE